ncbi:hypothetical protein [Spongiactinospora sp. TRM90649]|uniref:hypothetical protein n=1 Tax=Spongiactinospora sp. TRM90649 TaxID=3031114 RepID=UPI0023F83D81|nr:hypothetical protein [Spongiactinospora sp. TRM90649]MDF5752841.1 hypothetical protein [Spongiactinospora sp. TRM90649]
MSRRVAALAISALACLGTLAVTAGPAHAAVVETVYSPLSLGDYCAAQVNSSSGIGFYNGSVSCYRFAGSGLAYTGGGSASAACTYYHPTWTLIGYSAGVSQALVCKYSV